MKFEVKKSSSIIGEIRTDGHSPLMVLGNDFNTYVVKNDKAQKPPFYLLNECIASAFLAIWDLPAATTCLMELDKSLIVELDNLSPVHKPVFYDNLCFASRFISNTIDLNEILNQSPCNS